MNDENMFEDVELEEVFDGAELEEEEILLAEMGREFFDIGGRIDNFQADAAFGISPDFFKHGDEMDEIDLEER